MSQPTSPLIPSISCSTDAAFAPYAGVLLYTIARHFSGPSFTFHILDYGCTGDQQRRIERIARRGKPSISLFWHQRRLPAASPRERFETMCHDRLEFMHEASESYGRLLMLDVDLLVESDVMPLWQTDLRGHALGAVRDFAFPSMGDRFPSAANPLDTYYNIGVLLVDLSSWRAQSMTRQCLAQWPDAASPSTPYCPDQDAANKALSGCWQELDPSWNAQMIALQHHDRWPDSPWKKLVRPRLGELYHAPRIRHWCGPYKPWQQHSGCDIPFQDHYQNAFRHSGWQSRLEQWKQRWHTFTAPGKNP